MYFKRYLFAALDIPEVMIILSLLAGLFIYMDKLAVKDLVKLL